MDKMDENQKNLIKIGLYGGFLIIIVIVAMLSSRTNTNNTNNNDTNTKPNENPIIEEIRKIDENYNTTKIHLTMDDDAITLEYQKIDEVEIGNKKYHGETTEYTKYKNNYYILEEEKFKKLENFIDFDYDKTFTNILNINKLLDKQGTKTTYQINDLTVLKIEYTLTDALKIYNEYNGNEIMEYADGTITLEIYTKDEELEYIQLNATDLYNYLNQTNQENVIYKIEIKSNNYEDNSWLIEKLN